MGQLMRLSPLCMHVSCVRADYDEKNGKWMYYVHYHDFNRRMDDWVRVLLMFICLRVCILLRACVLESV
jgi:hypothetical protein